MRILKIVVHILTGLLQLVLLIGIIIAIYTNKDFDRIVLAVFCLIINISTIGPAGIWFEE
jgi:hypothetical protein